MVLMKYVDLYDSYYNENGELQEELVRENFLVPCDIDLSDVIHISPYYTRTGRFYRNVSILENRYGKTFKVVGNYNQLIKLRDNPPKKQIGYGKTTN
jgi:hypothetical protein